MNSTTVSAIRSIAAGDAVVSPKVTRRLLSRFIVDDPAPRLDPVVLDVLAYETGSVTPGA